MEKEQSNQNNNGIQETLAEIVADALSDVFGNEAMVYVKTKRNSITD